MRKVLLVVGVFAVCSIIFADTYTPPYAIGKGTPIVFYEKDTVVGGGVIEQVMK